MATKGIHLAIIPDGNRRWAKKRALEPWKGHEEAQGTLEKISEFCRDDERIDVLTLWVFSTENWNRDIKEVEKLMGFLVTALEKQRGKFQEHETRFVHSGRKDRLSQTLRKLIEQVEHETASFTKFTLNLALDYGGRDEIVRAVNKLKIPTTEEAFRSSLDHPELPDIDLIIRTSGEMRTSNFFLWQSAYAEWMFIDKFFPDFTVEDLKNTLENYGKRQRRFGE